MRQVEPDPLLVGVEHEDGDDLAEAERDDREVVAPEPQGREPDQDAGHGRDDLGHDQDEPDRDVDAGGVLLDADRAEVNVTSSKCSDANHAAMYAPTA